MSKIKDLEEQGYSYHLSALFAPQSIEKDDEDKYQKFEYENEVLDFLQSIDGTKNDRNVLSFLDNERIKEGKLCRHMVMVMPYCASCDAMEKLINDNKDSLKNLSDYEIINISGLNSQYTKIQEVKSKIATCESEDKKTITLTVNRMLTGCTVPQWDTMIFLKDTASPQDYDQAIFRLQSQYVVEYEGKEHIMCADGYPPIKKDTEYIFIVKKSEGSFVDFEAYNPAFPMRFCVFEITDEVKAASSAEELTGLTDAEKEVYQRFYYDTLG
jgi:hypothetical protein